MQQQDDFTHLPSKEGVLVQYDLLGSGTFGEVYDITEITEVGNYGRAGKVIFIFFKYFRKILDFKFTYCFSIKKL